MEEKLLVGNWSFYETLSPDLKEKVDSLYTFKVLSKEEKLFAGENNIEISRDTFLVVCCSNKFIKNNIYFFYNNKDFQLVNSNSNLKINGKWEIFSESDFKFIKLIIDTKDYLILNSLQNENEISEEQRSIYVRFDSIKKDTLYTKRVLNNEVKYNYLIDIFIRQK